MTVFAASAQEAEVNQYGQKVESIPIQASVQDGILVFQNKDANSLLSGEIFSDMI